MPIERAVPAICAIAPSMSIAFRSGIFVSAIWRTWSLVTLATVSRRGAAAPLSMPGGLAQQHRRRRRLGHERERAVLVDRDLGRDDRAPLGFRRRVVRLAEVHDVDAVRAERGTDRRRGGGRAGLDLDLHDRGNSSFRHVSLRLVSCLRATLA